jgi:predicted transcriptional regulator
MEVHFDIDDELLSKLTTVAREHDIPRDAAFRIALADWISQARREATVRELFEVQALQDE